MKLMEIDADQLGIPETEYDARVTLSASEFTRIVRDLSQLGESVRIEVSKEGVRFASEGEAANGNILLRQTEGAVITGGKIVAKKEDVDDEEDGEKDKGESSSKGKKTKVKKEKDEDVEMDEDEEEAKPDADEEGEEEANEDDDEDEEETNKKRKKKVCLFLCDETQTDCLIGEWICQANEKGQNVEEGRS